MSVINLKRLFSCGLNLTQNQRIRIGENPIVVIIIGIIFSHNLHLIQHQRIHTREREVKK